MNGLFEEISEEEMMSAIGGSCGAGGGYVSLPGFDVTGTAQVTGSTSEAISNACTYVSVCILGPLGIVGGATGAIGAVGSKIIGALKGALDGVGTIISHNKSNG